MKSELVNPRFVGVLTVVIPTHNRAALLREAIASVLASPIIPSPDRVVVVDDGSTDGAAEIIAKTGVRSLRVENRVPSIARNAGLSLATTEFVAFLDDDDTGLPGNLELQMDSLRSSPESAFAFGRVQRTAPDLTPLDNPVPSGPLPSGWVSDWIYANSLQLGAVLFRTSLLKDAGGFEQSLRYYEDSELLVRLARRHPAVGVDRVGTLFRQRNSSKNDADARWNAYRDFGRMSDLLRRSRALPGWRPRLASQFRTKGRTSYYFCADAAVAVSDGRRRDAVRYLSYALVISPLHSLLRQPRFWTTAARIVVPAWSESRRA